MDSIGCFHRFFLQSKIEPRIDDEAAHSSVSAKIRPSCERRDATEGVIAIDVGVRIGKVRMIQYIDRIESKLECLGFCNLESLHQIHIEVERFGSANRAVAKRSDFPRLGIDE